jgi:hypothetical protein
MALSKSSTKALMVWLAGYGWQIVSGIFNEHVERGRSHSTDLRRGRRLRRYGKDDEQFQVLLCMATMACS